LQPSTLYTQGRKNSNNKGLIFPTLSPAEYKAIAEVCNEFHDQKTVHVTDWDKFYVFQ
jgi:hypothetical protein